MATSLSSPHLRARPSRGQWTQEPKGRCTASDTNVDVSSIRVACLTPCPDWPRAAMEKQQGQLEDTPVPNGVRWTHYAAAFLVTAYLISVALRHVGSYIAPIDGWGVDLFEVGVGVLCMLRYWHGSWRTTGSAVAYFPLLLAPPASVGASATLRSPSTSFGGRTPPTPSAADGFGLMFFPLCYVAFVLLLRRDSKRADVTPWLDRAIAALGFASVAAAFALQPVLHAVGHWSLATATGIAYPVPATCCYWASSPAASPLPPGRARASFSGPRRRAGRQLRRRLVRTRCSRTARSATSRTHWPGRSRS